MFRDGLKPVNSAGFFISMYKEGNLYSKPYRKSAKTVGNVIGNYHPHGDISVYDAMVRLSQDWKMRVPLVDMQGIMDLLITIRQQQCVILKLVYQQLLLNY